MRTTIKDMMPTLTARSDGLYELAADWRIETTSGTVCVRSGFTTDGASVPRMAWFLAGHPMESPRVLAALAHDWLYASHVCPRDMADRIYRDILLRYRAKWRVNVEYAMLRMFGAAAWHSHGMTDRNFARKHGAFVRNRNNERKTTT